MRRLTDRSYLELFEQASRLRFTGDAFSAVRKELEREKEREDAVLRRKEESIEGQIEQARQALKRLPQDAAETSPTGKARHQQHCRIARLEKELAETRLARRQGVDIQYENRLAKLKVLESWPQSEREVQRALASERTWGKFGDYRDVGFRGGAFENQQDDVKMGQKALEEIKRYGMLPPAVESEEVNRYVRELAEGIARHSDLKVPLHVTVLQSQEINAFALPGGYLFVNSGLILEAENESHLAGVLAHEIGHIAARHSRRLMKRATIAAIIFQSAQVAALVLTGGAVGPGLYYALQYGFYGLGLALDLKLLGVSRDYEIEADILGAQYLWHAGYDPRSFISFFDKMARKEGYVTGLSWFRTHPPFYERMEETYSEILYLPPRKEGQVDSSEFHSMQARLREAAREMEKRDKNAPSLRRPSDCPELARAAGCGGSR